MLSNKQIHPICMFVFVFYQVSHQHVFVSDGLCFRQETTITDDRNFDMLCSVSAPCCCIFIFLCVLTAQDKDCTKAVVSHFFAVLALRQQGPTVSP